MNTRLLISIVIIVSLTLLLYEKRISQTVYTGIVGVIAGYYFGSYVPPAPSVSRIMKWSPSNWLLAQDCHFGYGLAIVFGVYAFRASLFWIPLILILELILKEGIFDQIVEGNPLIWSGLVDWSFYLLGSGVGFGLLHL